MSRFPNAFIDAVRDRHDVVEVVGRYVQLKKAGTNFAGLCPFHGEKTPSFTVSPTKQFYHCFGCGAHGNVISFLMEYTGLSFVEAIEDLARAGGLPLPERVAPTPEVRAKQEHESELKATLARAARHYHLNLRHAPETIDYLKGRGLDKKTVVQFGMGHAGTGIIDALSDVSTEVLLEVGLITRNEETGELRDRFRHRLMFPIRNAVGEVIGFGGRTMTDAEPKYLNTAETTVFHKGEELYGLDLAATAIRQSRSAIVVEGYMDVAGLHQFGEGRAVAALGTSLTVTQVARLFRLCPHLVLCFDGDRAGQSAADRAARVVLSVMTDGKRASFLTLPGDHDPDSFVRANGIQAWQEAIADSAVPLSTRVVEILRDGRDQNLPENRAAMAQDARDLLATIEHAPLFRDAMRAELERITGVSIPTRLSVPSQRVATPPVNPPPQASIPRPASERATFYRRFALLCALDVARSGEVPVSLCDEFSELIAGWFVCLGGAADRVEAVDRVHDAALRSTIAEALKSHADRTRILTPDGLARDADVLLSTISSELRQRERAQKAAALFCEQP